VSFAPCMSFKFWSTNWFNPMHIRVQSVHIPTCYGGQPPPLSGKTTPRTKCAAVLSCLSCQAHIGTFRVPLRHTAYVTKQVKKGYKCKFTQLLTAQLVTFHYRNTRNVVLVLAWLLYFGFSKDGALALQDVGIMYVMYNV